MKRTTRDSGWILLLCLATSAAVSGAALAADKECSIESQVYGWLEEQTTGLGVSYLDTAKRLLASLDADDVDISETEAKLTWNFDPHLALVAEVPTSPELFSPLKNELQSDQMLLQQFEDAVEEGDSFSLRLRYNFLKSGQKRPNKSKNRDAAVKRLPNSIIGTRASAVPGESEAAPSEDQTLQSLSRRSASIGELTTLDDVVEALLKRQLAVPAKQILTSKLKAEGKSAEDALKEVETTLGFDSKTGCELLQQVLAGLLGGSAPAEEVTRAQKNTMDEALGAATTRVARKQAKLAGAVKGKKAGAITERTNAAATKVGEVDDADVVSKAVFSDVISLLATAISNSPQLNGEVYLVENSALVGPSSWGARLRYVIGMQGGRKYLDSPKSMLRFLETAVNKPERIRQRRRFALLADYKDVDDYFFSRRLADPVTEPGGTMWSASAAYSVEFRTTPLGTKLKQDAAKDAEPSGSEGAKPPDPKEENSVANPIRGEILASYEDLPDSVMRPDDRFVVRATVTLPTQSFGDLTFGLAWASEPEFLTDLDFDQQVSARMGLVFKLGSAKQKSLFDLFSRKDQ